MRCGYVPTHLVSTDFFLSQRRFLSVALESNPSQRQAEYERKFFVLHMDVSFPMQSILDLFGTTHLNSTIFNNTGLL